MIKKEKNIISYIVWQEEDMFVSQCLNYDIASCGGTYDDAVAQLKEAIELYLENSESNNIKKYIPINNKNTHIECTHIECVFSPYY